MRFVIVTGMSGAGKSSALHDLEDAEYYCVDNLPLSLIRPFAEVASGGASTEYAKIAVGIDIRSGMRGKGAGEVLDELTAAGIRYEVLFLEASDEVLLMRYKETRRVHPLSGRAGSVESGIARERELLAPLRERADFIIDTSRLLTRELRSELMRVFVEGAEYRKLYVTVQSFGFKYGIPPDSDLVVDVRFLPNPYYQPELKLLTGLDRPVEDFVMGYPQSGRFIEYYGRLLDFLLPHYIEEGKNQLVISVGCTGGRHRSVVLAEHIASALSGDRRYAIRVEHRDIEKDPVRKSMGSEDR